MYQKFLQRLNKILLNPIFLICVILIAAFIRIGLIEHISLVYGRDIARELTAVYVKLDFVKNFDYSRYNILDLPNAFRAQNLHWWLPEGPIISTTWQNLSPLYYFTFTPFFILTGFLYTTSIYISIFTNISALILMYFFTKKHFGLQTAILSIFIYAFSYFNIKESLAGLNHSFVPPFTMLLLIGLYEVYKNKANYIYLIAFTIVGLLSYHASGFFIMPTLFFLLLYKIKSFKFKHYFFSILILFIGLFPYYLQEKMNMNRNINIFMEYFVYKNSQLLKPISFEQNQFNFYSVFSTTFGQYIFPLTPIAIGYFLSGLLVTFSFYKIIKRERPLIYIMLIGYLITFSLSAKFYTIVFMGWWFYGMALPISIIIFSNLLIEKINANKKLSNIPIIFFAGLFVALNLHAIYLSINKNLLQQYKNSKEIAKIVGKDTKTTPFNLYFYTKMEGDSQINTPTPFVYLVAYNSKLKNEYLKAELRPNISKYEEINVYVISDIKGLNSEKYLKDVSTLVQNEYKIKNLPKLIFKKENYTIYKSTFLNTKKQTDGQKK